MSNDRRKPGRSAKKRASDETAGRQVVDRRSGLDRRELAELEKAANAATSDESFGSEPTGLERRRGPGRRLSDFTKSAEEGEMNREQFLFLMAIEEFKRANGKTFPSWTDVLEVIRLLGYRKTMPTELKLRSAEDWTEPPTAPANVRPQRPNRDAGRDLDAA